jgi:PEP-CTERM motif
MANNTEYGAIANGPQLFSGSVSAPSFSPGTVNLDDGSFAVFGTSYPTTDNSITINETTSPVPEPSDVMLFGTGFLGLAGLAYRRFLRA